MNPLIELLLTNFIVSGIVFSPFIGIAELMKWKLRTQRPKYYFIFPIILILDLLHPFSKSILKGIANQDLGVGIYLIQNAAIIAFCVGVVMIFCQTYTSHKRK